MRDADQLPVFATSIFLLLHFDRLLRFDFNAGLGILSTQPYGLHVYRVSANICISAHSNMSIYRYADAIHRISSAVERLYLHIGQT